MQNFDPASRPPHLKFEYHAVEDRAASMMSGHYVSKDVLYMYITRPGQKDTHVVVYDDYLPLLRQAIQQGRAPAAWLDHIATLQKHFVEGNQPAEDGTAILGWPLLAPSTQKMLIQADVRTVETLAALDDAACNHIGMGCIGFREKARAWLQAAASTGKVAEELAAQSRIQAEQASLIDRLRKELEALKNPVTKA